MTGQKQCDLLIQVTA